ncbi:MAG: carboxypeptidase-like regulatory domain-containing protein [Methanococcaceae archaeon]
MKNYIQFITALIFYLNVFSLSGQQIIVRGKLLSQEDASSVHGAIVILNPGMEIRVTNQNGEFSFNTTVGKKELSTRYLGFHQSKVKFSARTDTTIIIQLEVDPFQINEVTILGDSVKSIVRSDHGNIIISRASLKESPRYFSEPDLIKSIQNLPGVVPGKDGTTDIFVRGGSPGQNVFLVNGCYFFLPSHLLGLTSSFDLDFIDRTEFIKDYFPSDIGGGASSVIKVDYREARQDSAGIQFRLGLLTSGLTFQMPIQKAKIGITGGIKRGNYSFYAPLLKTILNRNISDFLPPNDYTFYDAYLRVTHSSGKVGKLSYVYMRNYDNGSNKDKTESSSADTVLTSETGFISSWINQSHSIQWALPIKGRTRWTYDLNFNGISVQRENFLRTEKYLNDNTLIYSKYNSYMFSPEVLNIASKILFFRSEKNFGYSGGAFYRFRDFTPNILATDLSNEKTIVTKFVTGYSISEPSAFLSANLRLASEWLMEGGLRLSAGVTGATRFLTLEPRFRFTHESSKNFSQHLNYVRLSQFDHSLESSNVGLRSMLWLPITEEFGPEISDIFSLGINGQVKNYNWSMDLYYKTMKGLVDFKPGASFLYATSIDELLDNIKGRSYGLETFLVKRIGKFTGNFTYTFSRSKRDWYAPEGRIWIPSAADRPHNVNLALKYYWKTRTSFGLSWVYSSGLPATMYIHKTLSGRWFESKNNIRYPDYHRLDLSVRRSFKIKKTLINMDFDITNVYNRRNTFYLKEEMDETRKTFIHKNVSLFPIMPSISLSVQNSWALK